MRSSRSLLLILLLSLLLAGCSSGQKASPVLRSVSVEPVTAAENTTTLSLSGSVKPSDTVNLSFKLSGKLQEVLPKEGDYVSAGALIASMQTTDYVLQQNAAQSDYAAATSNIASAQSQYQAALAEYEAAKREAETTVPAQLEQAEAQLSLTQASYDRLSALWQSEMVSQSQMDEITAKLKADQATYQMALDAQQVADAKLQAARDAAEAYRNQISAAEALAAKADTAYRKAGNDLTDTRITSPINGTVMRVLYSAGETIAAGYPVAVIGVTDPVYVEVGVSDASIGDIYIGQTARITAFGSGIIRSGTVDEIAASADPTTRTYAVRLKVDNPDDALKSGMIVKAEFSSKNAPVITVPLDSVLQLHSGPVVFLYDANQQTVRRTSITTGEITGDRLEILSGLTEGDLLVTAGQFQLHDGDQVVLVEEKEARHE